MITTCGRCGAPTPAGARFCPGCGAALAEPPATSQALKTVTVLFTDMVGSTALGERFDPESLSGVMHEYFGTIRSVLERYGGSVEKFIGDAIMAVFGVPALHEDDALRAVSAAAAVHRSIDELSARLERDAGVTIRVRTGVNTGQVLSQVADQSTGRLVGDAVNVGARLQEAAGPGEILLGAATYQLVRDRVRTELLGPLPVKGRTAPVVTHRLLEVLPAAVTPARRRGPIVGRDREVRLLRETLQRVVEERSPHLFTVLGAPGVGKSRLVAELEAGDDVLVLQGRCLPYGEGITYWPLGEIVQVAAGIESEDPPEVAREKLTASLGDDEESAAVAEGVAQVVALSDADGGTDDLSWAIRKYFERLASRGPLVVVFDDVHWAEPAMLDLLDHLVDSVGDVPLLVVCTARLELLELRPAWGGGKMNASSLVLRPLEEAECRTLLRSLLGDSPSIDEVADAVFRVADGNPLFVEETVSMLVDDGLLERVEGQWRAARDLATLTVPPTIQALVSARLDMLTREEREVVGMAAVMGKVFAPRAIGELAPASVGGRVDEALGRLTRKQLVGPGDVEFAGGRTYSFRHLLIRDTAYEHLPRLTRATLHERYAEWLVKILGDRIAEYDEIVGYHLEQAHRYQSQLGSRAAERSELAERAADRLTEGARRAAARQDSHAAVKLFSRAAALLPDAGEPRLRILPDYGLALYESGEYDAAIAVFDEGSTLATELGDVRIATRCGVFKEMTRIHRDPDVNAEESRAVAERAVRTLGELGDDYGSCYAWNLLAYIHDSAGRSGEALESLRHAAEHAERSGVASTVAHQKRTLLRSLAWGPGTVSEILPLAEDLLQWSRTRRDRYSESRALLTLAQAHAMTGDFGAARAFVAEQQEVCEDVSLQFVNSWGAFERTGVEILAGDLAAAEAHARAGCDFLERKGERAMLPTLQTLLADVLYMRGAFDEALGMAEAAAGISTPDDALTETKWRSVIAKVRARRGEVEPAIELASEAVAIAEATGYLDWYAGIVSDLGEVMTLAGRPEEAGRAYARSVELFARKGNVVAERSVRQRSAT